MFGARTGRGLGLGLGLRPRGAVLRRRRTAVTLQELANGRLYNAGDTDGPQPMSLFGCDSSARLRTFPSRCLVFPRFCLVFPHLCSLPPRFDLSTERIALAKEVLLIMKEMPCKPRAFLDNGTLLVSPPEICACHSGACLV